MREILFKAKPKDWREHPKDAWWVEGYYAMMGTDNLIKHYIVQNCAITRLFKNPEDNMYFNDVEIDPETLCQYTGLKDKNGNRIWENDIVLLREEIQEYEWKAMVKFGNPNWEYNWGWQLVPIGECDMNKDILLWIDMEIASCEVVGNIFDNPELLEG